MRGECEKAHEGCKYFETGCFSDTDHIVPQRLATTALTAVYIDLPANKQQMCREEHEAKTAAGDEPLPEREIMKKAIIQAHLLGEIALSRNKMKAIFGRNWKSYREVIQASKEQQ